VREPCGLKSGFQSRVPTRVIPNKREPLCGERAEREPEDASSVECRFEVFPREFAVPSLQVAKKLNGKIIEEFPESPSPDLTFPGFLSSPSFHDAELRLARNERVKNNRAMHSTAMLSRFPPHSPSA
jgi:hypothetical protein